LIAHQPDVFYDQLPMTVIIYYHLLRPFGL